MRPFFCAGIKPTRYHAIETTMLKSWKFAADAVWEEALTLDASEPLDLTAIQQWVHANPQNIAFEAIFSETGKPDTMFGVRITHLSKAEQASRIAMLLSRTGEILSEADFRKAASEVFPEHDLFSEKLTAMNIGIVGHWYSFVPQTLWTPEADAPLTVNELEQHAPRFFEQTRNPAAVEFWYTQPVDHWYKIYVSDECEDGFRISENKYALAIGRMQDFDRN